MTDLPPPSLVTPPGETRCDPVEVQRFEYMPSDEAWALLRLMANLPSDLPLPSAPLLAIRSPAGLPQLETGRRVRGRPPQSRGADMAWVREFLARLEDIRRPGTSFELLLDGLPPLLLPAPVLAEACRRTSRRRGRLARIAPLVVVSCQAWLGTMCLPAGASADSPPAETTTETTTTTTTITTAKTTAPLTATAKTAAPTTKPTPPRTRTGTPTPTTTRRAPITKTTPTPTTTTKTTAPATALAPAPVKVTAARTPPPGTHPSVSCAPSTAGHDAAATAGSGLTGAALVQALSSDKPDARCSATGHRRHKRRSAKRHHKHAVSNHRGAKPSQTTTSTPPPSSNAPQTATAGGPTFAPTPADTALLSSIAVLYAPQSGPPAFLISIYRAAGRLYDIPWQVLAAINWIETDYGRDLSISSAGAVGWMQFMPATWQMYGVAVGHTGQPDPYNPTDAIFAAAQLLHDNGGSHDLPGAIFAYNHATWYVDDVLWLAGQIAPGNLPQAPTYSGYVYPLSLARDLVVERTDEGKDFSMAPGSPILAIGASVITAINPNWYAGQPQIVGQFTDGPLAGQFWYVAEQVEPTVSVGQAVPAGGLVAIYASSGTGIEYGFSANAQGETLAQATPGYSGDQSQAAIGPNGAGTQFSDLLALLSLGTPPRLTLGEAQTRRQASSAQRNTAPLTATSQAALIRIHEEG